MDGSARSDTKGEEGAGGTGKKPDAAKIKETLARFVYHPRYARFHFLYILYICLED
jgi:hypothetical protein